MPPRQLQHDIESFLRGHLRILRPTGGVGVRKIVEDLDGAIHASSLPALLVRDCGSSALHGICIAGAVVGLLLGHLGVQLAAPMIERYGGAAFEMELLLPEEPLLLLGMAGVGALAGALPAARAYRADVASSL